MTGGAIDSVDARADVGRRRFTIAVVSGLAIAAVPYLWVLWDLWTGRIDALRHLDFQSNFFDVQARAMLHGHLYLPKGAIGVEAFVHNGHEYTYFGLFPSLIRMPILALTHHYDARMTAPSMLLAWIMTAVFSSLLVWRIRIMMRGATPLGWPEAVSYGVLVAVVTSGSVLVFLAATPSSFHEDLAWSVGLTIAAMFALLGVLERPTVWRVVGGGVLILAANLTRSTTGWSCVIATILIAVWFRMGRGGDESRRWALPVLTIGLIPLAVSAVVTYAKFGVLFGLPMTDQVYSHVNAYRKQFLAANGNSEVGLQYMPSALVAYLQPFGLRFSGVFPYVTLPANPAKAFNDVLFDRRYRTASLPASMPLLFFLGGWGVIVSFRRRVVDGLRRVRILLVASAASGAAIFIWGYLANRYLADFLPFLAIAATAGMVDVWRRWEHGSRRTHGLVLGAVALVGLFGIVANVGVAITPSEYWSSDQARRFVEAQQSMSDLTGHQLEHRVVQGARLPPRAPADQIFIAGDCAGLYISNGEDLSPDPDRQFERGSWTPIERGRPYRNDLQLTFSRTAANLTEPIPVISSGHDRIVARVERLMGDGKLRIHFELTGEGKPIVGFSYEVPVGTAVPVSVLTDPQVHRTVVTVGGEAIFATNRADHGAVVVHTGPVSAPGATAGGAPAVTVVHTNRNAPKPALCRSLLPKS
ncbi:MAG: hypothetical protein ACXVJW_03250 [Acidimicrobiia bacterium]